jgi:hypothetical protein
MCAQAGGGTDKVFNFKIKQKRRNSSQNTESWKMIARMYTPPIFHYFLTLKQA